MKLATGNPTLDELCRLRKLNDSFMVMIKKAGEAISSSYDVDVYPDGTLGKVRDELREFLDSAGLESAKIATAKEPLVAAFVTEKREKI